MTATLDNRPLPHSVEVESCVLGCVLTDDRLVEKALQAFGGKEVFYSRKNKTIYAAMTALHDKRLPIDLVNLRHHLKESGRLDIVGEDYLLELEEAVPHVLSFDYFAGELLKLFDRRKKIEAATRVIEGAYAGVDADTSELMPLLENSKTDSGGIVRPLDIEAEVMELHKNGGLPRGLSTGWPGVDQHYTVLPGLLTVITGIPSHGKSTWLSNLLVNLAVHHNWKFAVFSPENMPLKRYVAEIIGIYAGKRFNILVESELTYSLEWVQNHFFFINPSDSECTIDHLIDKAKYCVEKYAINGFVADPWNEINHTRPDGLSETEHTSICLSKLKRLAQTQNIHAWLVAHPTKLLKNKDGSYPVPTAYDISGSAHFRNKADSCLSIWRDVLATDGISELHIQKARFREIGKPGMVRLRYVPATGRYENFDLGELEE